LAAALDEIIRPQITSNADASNVTLDLIMSVLAVDDNTTEADQSQSEQQLLDSMRDNRERLTNALRSFTSMTS